MGELLYSWLYSLLASGCICSLFLFLNIDGKWKGLLETGCACIMLLTFVSPFTDGSHKETLNGYFEKWTSIELNEQMNEQYSIFNQSYMEGEYRTYILNEAAKSGVTINDVMVDTVLDENGLWVPAEIVYVSDAIVPDAFKARIHNDFGITEERDGMHESK